MSLDSMDIEILRNLQQNSRISYSKLAKKLGIPESTLKFRVRRLIEEGVIERFTIIVNPSKVGYELTLLMFVICEPGKVDFVFEEIAGFKETYHVFQMTGRHDLVVVLHAKDMDHANKIVRRVKMIEGVKEVETTIATGKLKLKNVLEV